MSAAAARFQLRKYPAQRGSTEPTERSRGELEAVATFLQVPLPLQFAFDAAQLLEVIDCLDRKSVV